MVCLSLFLTGRLRIFEIQKNLEVYVRAHMNNTSYSSKVFKGSVESGFTAADLEVEFAKELEEVSPLPSACDF